MKNILALVFVCTFFYSNAQTDSKKTQTLTNINNFENSKGGNYKDILNSFFQLATKNFAGNDKTIEMNSTLFALKAKANPELITGNFQAERFSRNFQFNFKLNLDNEYKYKGFTGGFTYAIFNKRDLKLAVLTNTLYGKNFETFRNIIDTICMEINDEILATYSNDSIANIEVKKLNNATKTLHEGKNYSGNDKMYYDKIIKLFEIKAKEKLTKNDTFNNTDIKEFADYLKYLEKTEKEKINAQPLWTLAIDGSAIEKGKFNKASFETIFLKGVKNTLSEIDIRAKLVYADTITTTPMPRMDFNTKAGINFKLGKGANDVSYFETKIAMEYNNILKNILPSEKKTNFLANAEIRVRLADDLWLPLIIKYNIENANFLGFLNLSYNFGSFTSNTKPKG